MARLLFLAMALVLGACSDSAPPDSAVSTALETITTAAPSESTTLAPSPTTTATTPPSEPEVPEQLTSFRLDTIRLNGDELLVAVADTPSLRRLGLMNVTDLGDLDGMLFVFAADSSGGFWMKNTLIPLDIAFFEVGGAFVDGFVMEPCTTPSCPTYRPRGPYRYALEMPAGRMPATVETLGLNQDQ